MFIGGRRLKQMGGKGGRMEQPGIVPRQLSRTKEGVVDLDPFEQQASFCCFEKPTLVASLSKRIGINTKHK